MMRSILLLGFLVVAACTQPTAKDLINFKLSPAQHAEFFPIEEGNVHALEKDAYGGALSCDSCHKGTATFAEFKCIECHEHDGIEFPGKPRLYDVHLSIAGFSAANSACLSCHPDGEAGFEQGLDVHNINDFPIGVDSPHGDADFFARVAVFKPELAGGETCNSCHAEAVRSGALLCAECHALDTVLPADVHVGSTGFEQSFANGDDSPGCKKCHAETPVPPAVVPIIGHNDIFIAVPQHHNAQRCDQCHKVFEPAPKPWAIDWKATDCLTCHDPGCVYDPVATRRGTPECD